VWPFDWAANKIADDDFKPYHLRESSRWGDQNLTTALPTTSPIRISSMYSLI
jgi:hypothetical protein